MFKIVWLGWPNWLKNLFGKDDSWVALDAPGYFQPEGTVEVEIGEDVDGCYVLERFIDYNGEENINDTQHRRSLEDDPNYELCSECGTYIFNSPGVIKKHLYKHYRQNWPLPRVEYYLDQYGNKNRYHPRETLHAGWTTLLDLEKLNYDPVEEVFYIQGSPSLMFYKEKKMRDKLLLENPMKETDTVPAEDVLPPRFVRKLEDTCDLTCPRDCECWNERHPDVLAAYENPTGPKGNTDLDEECDCLSCAVETVTEVPEKQFNPWVVPTAMFDTDRPANFIMVPFGRYIDSQMNEGEATVTPSGHLAILRNGLLDIVSCKEIKQIHFQLYKGSYYIWIDGVQYPFTFEESYRSDFFSPRFQRSGGSTVTRHWVRVDGDYVCDFHVDADGNLIKMSNGETELTDVMIPSNHEVFNYITVKTNVKVLL